MMTSKNNPPARNENRGAKQTNGVTTYLSPYVCKIEALDTQPRRHWLIHWSALVLSLVSLAIQIIGMAVFQKSLPGSWARLDLAICILFVIEFFTRSGFHWNRWRYARSHFFDFIALVPVLLFLHDGIFAEGILVWLILIARFMRAVDRILGDGFILHNFWALLEGFEEEITDRVTLRIMDRVQVDMTEGRLGLGAADAMEKNKEAVLKRVRAEHPHDTLGADLARWVGLEDAIKRAEERIYDAMVDVLRSHEVDTVIRTSIDTVFVGLRAEVGRKEWKRHLGIPGRHASKITEARRSGGEKVS